MQIFSQYSIFEYQLNHKKYQSVKLHPPPPIYRSLGGGVAQWLGRRISDQGVPGSNPGRCTYRCGHEQVTFTLLSTG